MEVECAPPPLLGFRGGCGCKEKNETEKYAYKKCGNVCLPIWTGNALKMTKC